MHITIVGVNEVGEQTGLEIKRLDVTEKETLSLFNLRDHTSIVVNHEDMLRAIKALYGPL
jgi:hypothetical protein